MAATNKAAWFKVNPGGSEVVNVPVLPAANGTWENYTSATEATAQTAQVAAGYLSFDYPVSGVLAGFRIPFYSAPA
jgi:hypothetical protein